MNNYFTEHEQNSGFSTKSPGEKNFPKQTQKFTAISSQTFYRMEFPHKSKFLIDRH